MLKRLSISLMVVGSNLLFLAACWTGPQTDSLSSVDEMAGNTPSAEAREVTITWWTEGFPSVIPAVEMFEETFNNSHEDVKLDLVPQDNLVEALRLAAQGGAAPDIIQLEGPAVMKEFFDAGLIVSLDEYAEKYGWREKLVPWAFDTGVFDGSFFSVPMTFESMLLVYNKTLFEENGWEVPTSAEELESLAEEMDANGIVPFSYGNVGYQPTNEHLVTAYLNNCAGPRNVYLALCGQKEWTDPEFVESIELLRTHMVENGWFGGSLENYYSYGWDDFWSQLANGDAGMMMIGTWLYSVVNDKFIETGMDWGVAPLPSLCKRVEDVNYPLAVGNTLAIYVGSDNPGAAAEVFDYLLSNPARTLRLSQAANFGEWLVPLSYDDEDVPEESEPRFVGFLNDFTKVTLAGGIGYTTWTFWPPEARTQLWESIEQVWAGELSVEDYLAEQQQLWERAREGGGTLSVPPRD